jgi:hypothetical protein
VTPRHKSIKLPRHKSIKVTAENCGSGSEKRAYRNQEKSCLLYKQLDFRYRPMTDYLLSLPVYRPLAIMSSYSQWEKAQNRAETSDDNL